MLKGAELHPKWCTIPPENLGCGVPPIKVLIYTWMKGASFPPPRKMCIHTVEHAVLHAIHKGASLQPDQRCFFTATIVENASLINAAIAAIKGHSNTLRLIYIINKFKSVV